MCFLEKEISGLVEFPATPEQLQPRQLDRGSRNVPTVMFRIKSLDGVIWAVKYYGEMQGTIYPGDFLIVRGYHKSSCQFKALKIWLRGHTDSSGELLEETKLVLLAETRTCAIATALYGSNSYQVLLLQNFRDTVLTDHLTGRWLIKIYNYFSPWIAERLFDFLPRSRMILCQLIDVFIVLVFGKETQIR